MFELVRGSSFARAPAPSDPPESASLNTNLPAAFPHADGASLICADGWQVFHPQSSSLDFICQIAARNPRKMPFVSAASKRRQCK